MNETKSEQLPVINSDICMASIIELTAYRHYIPLTRAFLKHLNHISGVQKSNVYEVLGNSVDKLTDASLLKNVLEILSLPAPFYEKINQYSSQLGKQQSQNHLESDTQQIVFPIQSNSIVQRILVIDWNKIHPDNWTYIIKLLEVYNNLLDIIDEKDRDQLTGLLNRHTFDNNLQHIINYSKIQSEQARGGSQSWIAILDIDHFKQVNDNFGHIMGDEVLLLFSQFMMSTFRYSDIVFRFGGEEFIVVLTGCDRQGAEMALDRFKKVIENHPFPQVGQITVSAGYILLDSSNPPNILLDHADQALYHAKQTGRNKVVFYQDIAESLKEAEQNTEIELF